MTTEFVHISFYERRPGAASVCVDTETLTFTPVRRRNSFTDWEYGEYYPEYNGEPEDFVRCCGFGVGFDVFKVSVKKDPDNGKFVGTMENTAVVDILKEDWERWAPLEGKIEGKMTFLEMQRQHINAGFRKILTSTTTTPGFRSRPIHLAKEYRSTVDDSITTPPPSDTPMYSFMITVSREYDEAEEPHGDIKCYTYDTPAQ